MELLVPFLGTVFAICFGFVVYQTVKARQLLLPAFQEFERIQTLFVSGNSAERYDIVEELSKVGRKIKDEDGEEEAAIDELIRGRSSKSSSRLSSTLDQENTTNRVRQQGENLLGGLFGESSEFGTLFGGILEKFAESMEKQKNR